MHCPNCGYQILPDTRFCPNCGKAVPTAAYAVAPSRPALLRPRSGRMIAGVCAAFARTYGWNVTLVRILLVVLTPLHLGLGFLAYIVAWIVIPEEPILLPYAPAPPPSSV